MAVTSVTTTMAGAINYTVVTDTSADWPSVANSTYFYDKATKLVYFKNSSGTVLEIFSGSGLTVGTTTVTSGTDGRVFFQAGGVVQQDANFTFDNTLKRLTLKASGATVTDIPFRIRNSADNADLFIVYGTKAFTLGNSVSSDGFTTYLGTAGGITQITASGNGLSLTSNFASVLNATNNVSIQTNGLNRLYFDNAGLIGVGNTTPGARLDVRAQGALSTDIAFRVRNSADTLNMFDVNGLGEVNTKVGNQNLLYINSTAGFSSAYTGQNFIVNTSVSGIGNSKNNMVLINASDSSGSGTAGVTAINSASTVPTSVFIGSGVANSNRIQLGGISQIGFNLSCNMGSMIIGSNMSWSGGGTSTGMFVFGNNVGNLVNGFANAIVMGINQVDFVIGGGKGNIGVAYNPTGRAETNTMFVSSGTSPITSITDGFQQYSKDIVAGNAAPHFRTENGAIVKVYQETTAVTAAAFVSNTSLIVDDSATYGGYTMGQVVAALKAQGLLA